MRISQAKFSFGDIQTCNIAAQIQNTCLRGHTPHTGRGEVMEGHSGPRGFLGYFVQQQRKTDKAICPQYNFRLTWTRKNSGTVPEITTYSNVLKL